MSILKSLFGGSSQETGKKSPSLPALRCNARRGGDSSHLFPGCDGRREFQVWQLR